MIESFEIIDYTKEKVEGIIKICPKCKKPGKNQGVPKNYYIHKIKQRKTHDSISFAATPAEVIESCLIK